MIRIIAGTYGMRKGKSVIPVTKNSGPISLPEEQENELVAQGIAVFVGKKVSDSDSEGRIREEKASTAERNTQEESFESMKLAKLKERAREYGIDPDGVNRKADLIAAIREAQAEEDTVEDNEAPPQLEAEGIV